ncbi:hypothetical protein BJ912DRAFT_996153 [Pholiota molesta]|nr:hypothetical protein BJ912DRAFT_996153 [Pholiota molesta]
MATIGSTFYHFDQRKIANWSTTQEKTISQDYPFQLQDVLLEQYVQRTYLQFLWLPDSLMPLHLLIPSLRRVNIPSTSDSDASIHPMHALLDPLLLTTRSATNKYHVELPRILINGGGAGEMEETMMWYAVTHEKPDESVLDSQTIPEHAEGPWVDEKWREAYLERMERREVQIQILLYFYKLSLPGPLPRAKKPRKRKLQPVEPMVTTEEHLEAFMDKLSMWQLVGSLDRAKPTTSQKKTDERDWTQAFLEDIVERYFRSQLPELCSLLRSKLFPSSPFSDDDEDVNDTLTAPDPASQIPAPDPSRRSLSRAPSTARLPSPTPSTTTNKPRAPSTTHALARARSRSLSVSLAQEQHERALASAAPAKKRPLNREVSMSRVFKPRPKPTVRPAPPPQPQSEAPKGKEKAVDGEVVLVEDTPQKPRGASAAGLTFGVGRQPSFGAAPLRALSMQKAVEAGANRAAVLQKQEEDDGDGEWMMDSSPNIVLLNPPPRSSSVSSGVAGMDSEEEDVDVDMGEATPSKPSRVLRRR